jgi:Secretion system C-terminal sorting domain
MNNNIFWFFYLNILLLISFVFINVLFLFKYYNMLKLQLLVLSFFFCAFSTAQFVSNNIIVSQLGDGTITYNGGAAARCVLKEFNTSGSLISTSPIPIVTTGNNRRFMLNNGFFGGNLSLSTDSRYILIGGYDVAEESQPTASLTAQIAPRIVARIDKNKVMNTSTVTGQYGGDAIIAAYSNNGYDIWTTGGSINGAGGIRYLTLGATNSILINNGDFSSYQIIGAGNQLYTCSGTSYNVGAIGTGFPTNAATITNLQGLPLGANRLIVSFFFADVNTSIAGNDVLYMLSSDAFGGTNELLKYSLVGSNWVLNNTIALATPRGITGKATGTTVDVYIVNNTNLLKLTDNAGYNSNIVATLSSIATAPTNTTFKGVCFAPDNVPLPPPANPTVINLQNNCIVKATPSFAKITNWVNGYSIIATKNGLPLTINVADTSFEYFTPGQNSGTYSIQVKFIQTGQTSESNFTQVVTSMLPPQVTNIQATTATPYCINKNIAFTASISNIGDNPIYTWRDGNTTLGTSTTPNFNTQFSTVGQKTINVIVNFTIGTNCIAASLDTSEDKIITITPAPPSPTINAGSTTNICTGGNVVLTSNASTGNQWFLNAVAISGATNPTYTANASGSYTVNSTNGGCTSVTSAATIVTLNPLPIIPIINWNGSLLSTNSGFASYKWFLNNVEIVGAINNTFLPTVNGSYKVEITNVNGCKSTSIDYILVSTAMNTINIEGAIIEVMPNPANQFITIKQTGQLLNYKLTAVLYNSNGALLTTTLIKNTSTKINVTALLSGMYRLKIIGQKLTKNINVIIIH